MASVTLRMDDDIKTELDQALDGIGMNISTFYLIYTKRFLSEGKIPFEISVPKDAFFSESNIAQLKKAGEQIRQGRVVEKSFEELEAMANE